MAAPQDRSLGKMTLENIRDFARPIMAASPIVFIIAGAIIVAVLEIVSAGMGQRVVDAVTAFLTQIPDAFYQLSVAGFLGYTGARTVEKVKNAAKPIDIAAGE